MKKEHLIVIIDNKDIVEPKIYACPVDSKTREEALISAKALYEKNNGNKDYKSYHFIH